MSLFSIWKLQLISNVRFSNFICCNFLFKKTRKQFPTLMLTFMFLYLNLGILIVKLIRDNIKFWLILRTSTFLLTIMLLLWLFSIRSSTLVYLKKITYIQCQLCVITTMIYYRSNSNKIFPTTMLEYLVIRNSYVTTVYMETISNIKYQLDHFHLEECFIQQKQETDCQYLCYHFCSST